MDDRWLFVDAIAEYLGISRDTVYTWLSSRELPGHRVGRLWKFKRDEVDAWVRAGKATKNQAGKTGMSARAHESKPRRSLPPGLDPATPYYSRLSARSALYTDLCLLLNGASGALDPLDFRDMIIEQNCLARSSESARRKMWKELKARYVLNASSPIFAAFWWEWKRCESEPERGLTAYCLLALQDKLVADLGLEFLFPRLRRAPAELRVGDVLGFIKASAAAHPEVGAWSENTTIAVAQKYGASIRDFGLARGTIRKTTVRPALYGAPTRLLVRALRLTGTRDPDLVRAPIFKLLGLEPGEVIDALGELNRQGALRFRMQGDIVELKLGGQS